MTPFLAKGAHTFKGRIRGEDGVPHIVSLGTKDEAEAAEIERMFRWLAEKRKWPVLELILSKAVKPTAVLDAYVGGYLERLVSDTAKRKSDAVAAAADPLLTALVDDWSQVALPRYVAQVRKFVASLSPEPTLAKFRRAAVSDYLGKLKKRNGKAASGSTKRRYRVALSQFARWLVERELLDTNIVRDVRGARENRPRMAFHTRAEAQALVNVLEGQQKPLEALMAGTGVEWGAAIAVRRRDIDPAAKSVWAQGTKNQFRSRRVFFTEDWAWSMFWEHAKQFTDAGKVFRFEGSARKSSGLANEVHRAGCVAARVKVTKLHDWRHTYAIYSLEDGIQPQAVKANLGHSPHSTELERVYAAWIPKDAAAYRKRLVATDPATNGGQKKQRPLKVVR